MAWPSEVIQGEIETTEETFAFWKHRSGKNGTKNGRLLRLQILMLRKTCSDVNDLCRYHRGHVLITSWSIYVGGVSPVSLRVRADQGGKGNKQLVNFGSSGEVRWLSIINGISTLDPQSMSVLLVVQTFVKTLLNLCLKRIWHTSQNKAKLSKMYTLYSHARKTIQRHHIGLLH